MEEKIEKLTLKILSLFDKMAISYGEDPFENLANREISKNKLQELIKKELLNEE